MITNKKQKGSYADNHGADCVIFTNAEPCRGGLQILHVTEGLSYHPDKQEVCIHLDIFCKNTGTKAERLRIIHRGKVEAYLQRFAFSNDDDKCIDIMKRLFYERIRPNQENEQSILFNKRVNCLGIDPEAITVSLSGPGDCFEKIQQPVKLVPEVSDRRQDAAFTSYLIPPPPLQPIQPSEVSVFTMKLSIQGSTYARLVGDGSEISVDSYTRLMRDIETYDLPLEANIKLKRLYEKNVEDNEAVIEPVEYDIVIFQSIGQKLILQSNSISATPIQIPSVSEKEALCFLGQPKEFCLKFSYPDEVVAKQRSILSNMLVETSPLS